MEVAPKAGENYVNVSPAGFRFLQPLLDANGESLGRNHLLLSFDRNTIFQPLEGEQKTEIQLEFSKSLTTYQQRLDVEGFDVLGPETTDHDDASFVTYFLESQVNAWRKKTAQFAGKPMALVIRAHIGEGFHGRGGKQNVKAYLQALASILDKAPPPPGLHFIIAHAVHVDDPPHVNQLIRRLQALGVSVTVNVNPLSNLAFEAATDVARIDALRLTAGDLRAGTDNIGTLAQNQTVFQHLQKQNLAEARQEAATYLETNRQTERNELKTWYHTTFRIDGF